MEDKNRMEGIDPEDLTHDGRPRCTAQSKQNKRRCRRAATPGTNVCISHGSGAPQVRRAAKLRLLSLVDPAIATLAREMTQAPKSSDKLRAANSILDRAGIARSSEVRVDDARELLVERLRALRDGAERAGIMSTDETDDDTDIMDDEESDE